MRDKLRARLERLRRSGELTPARPVAKPRQRDAEERFLFPGEESLAQTAFGSCYLRELAVPLEQRHGDYTLGKSLACAGSDLSLAARDSSLQAVAPERYLFLDIETTGLAGGTGTWVFMIGLGWLAADSFRIRQYFLRHPAEEKAMLQHFAAFAAPFSSLVTFNGKAFDLPLIQTRQTLRKTPQTEPQEHLDLLVCARSLWRKRFPSRRLTFLEEALLGFERRDDIPGEEIPEVYFRYLRRGETGRLLKVFE
ncbi:MAG: ribonuclease H-like domain-containing protein, partial [Firmicutes bacterium]|nr:ribonuclease H-like domain-containing protein [Bacillota bacterium]